MGQRKHKNSILQRSLHENGEGVLIHSTQTHSLQLGEECGHRCGTQEHGTLTVHTLSVWLTHFDPWTSRVWGEFHPFDDEVQHSAPNEGPQARPGRMTECPSPRPRPSCRAETMLCVQGHLHWGTEPTDNSHRLQSRRGVHVQGPCSCCWGTQGTKMP